MGLKRQEERDLFLHKAECIWLEQIAHIVKFLPYKRDM